MKYIDLFIGNYKIVNSDLEMRGSDEYFLAYELSSGGNLVQANIEVLFNSDGDVQISEHPFRVKKNSYDLFLNAPKKVSAELITDESTQIVLSLLVATRNGIGLGNGHEYDKIYHALDRFINKKIDNHVDKNIDPMKYLEAFI